VVNSSVPLVMLSGLASSERWFITGMPGISMMSKSAMAAGSAFVAMIPAARSVYAKVVRTL
jgi:hypothetical protein